MEDLKTLSHAELLERLRNAASEERRAQLAVVKLLAEAERRQMYAARGYRSLFDFCVKDLGYGESTAWRRISAMRLLKEIPQAEEQLSSGRIKLTQATAVQNFLYTQSRNAHRTFSPEQKLDLLKSIENKTTRETERVLADLAPGSMPSERERPINGQETEIRFVADNPLKTKFDRLKDLNSHRDPSRSYARLFEWLSDLGLRQADPALRGAAGERSGASNGEVAEIRRPDRYIPAALRRAVWARDGGRCTYRDRETGRVCGATRFLEIDHIQPVGLGGETKLENLRLYCRTHNQAAAVVAYGERKMAESRLSSAQQGLKMKKGGRA